MKKLSITAALALSLLASPACKKDKDSATKPGEEKTATSSEKKVSETAMAEPASSAQTSAIALAGILAHFPASTEVVVSLNVGNFVGSPLWKQYGALAMASAPKELQKFKALCGFDLMTSVESVSVGVNSVDGDEPVIIVNGLGRDQVTRCIKAVAKATEEKLSLTEDGKFTFLVGDGEKQAIAWLGDSSLLLVPQKSDKAYLQARLDGTDSLAANQGFGAMAAKAKQSAPIWFAGSFSKKSPIASQVALLGAAPTGFYGSLGFEGGIDIALGLHFADAQGASTTLAMAQAMLPMAKGVLGDASDLVDKVKMGVSGADLTVSLLVTDADVDKLKSAAGPLLGGMGGL